MVLSATVMLVDLSVATKQVTVPVATMQLQVSAAFMQVKVSAVNMCMTIFVEITQMEICFNYAGGIFCSALRT